MRKDERNVSIRRDDEVIPASDVRGRGRHSLQPGRHAEVGAHVAGSGPDSSGERWLSQAQRDALWSAQMPMPLSERQRDWDGSRFNAYGYGWRLSDVDGVLRVAHTGTLAGMYSAVTLLPEKGIGFVFLINGEGGEARTVLNEVLVKQFTAPGGTWPVATTRTRLTRERAAQPPHAKAPDVSARKPARLSVVQPIAGHLSRSMVRRSVDLPARRTT